MRIVNLPHLLKIVTALILTSPPAHAAVIVNDGFTDGARTDGADAQDLAWYVAQGGTLTIVNDTTIGSGNAMQIFWNGAAFAGAVGVMGSAVTLNDGDSLTLSFSWRFSTLNASNQSSGVRFGIHSSFGTVTTADSQTPNPRLNDKGYVVMTNPGLASSTGTGIFRETGGNNEVAAGSDLTAIGTSGDSINALMAAQTASFSLARSGNSLSLTTNISGQAPATATDNSPLTYTYDQLYIGLGNIATRQWNIDNVQLTYTPVPEPAPIALSLLGMIGLMAMRFRGNTRSLN